MRVVLTKTHTAIATLYYLLLDNILSKRKTAGLHGMPNPNHCSSNAGQGLTRTHSANGSNRVGIKAHPYYMNTVSGAGSSSKGPTIEHITPSSGGNHNSNSNNATVQNQLYRFAQPQVQQAMPGDGNTRGAQVEAAGLSSQPRPRSASASRSSVQRPLIGFVGNR